MFDTIRANRWLAFVLSLPVFVVFIASGVYGFSHFLTADNSVAKIDGSKISQQELEEAHRNRTEQFRQAYGARFDPKMMDSPRARAATLDALLSERAIEHEVEKDGLAVSDSRLRDAIRAIPNFQKEGHFDYETYKLLLQAKGYSEAGFEASMRADLAKQDLGNAVTSSAILPQAVSNRLWQIGHEQRQVQIQRFSPENYMEKAAPSEQAISAYYDSHKNELQRPESVKAEYLVLSLDDLAAQAVVSPEEVKTYYEQNAGRFGEPEQRRASHILITAGPGGSAPDKDAARRKAQDLLAQLRADPAKFAALARQYSKDPGSAEKGGDLDWFGRGMMVKPFEDAAFALKRGQISDVIESNFGFHIIRLDDIKGGGQKSFEQAKPEIEDLLRHQEAQKNYAAAAEQFSNMVYEQADSLQPAADKFKLKVQTAENLTHTGPLADPAAAQVFVTALREALFASDSLQKKRNVAAVEIGANRLASARVLSYQPAAPIPLAEIHDPLRVRLQREEAIRLARAAGEERLKALQAKPDDTGFEPLIHVSRDEPKKLPPAAIAGIMKAPAAKLPAFAGAELDGGAYGVIRILAVDPVESPDAAKLAGSRDEWLQQVGNGDQVDYIRGLRERFDAKVVNPALVASPAGRAGETQ